MFIFIEWAKYYFSIKAEIFSSSVPFSINNMNSFIHNLFLTHAFLPNNSFNVVFPQLPVIAIIFVFIFSLYNSELFVKNFRGSLILIWREIFIFFSILLTTAIDAFFLKASLINLLPSFFFPLIAKKISPFFISLEFIDVFFIIC